MRSNIIKNLIYLFTVCRGDGLAGKTLIRSFSHYTVALFHDDGLLESGSICGAIGNRMGV